MGNRSAVIKTDGDGEIVESRKYVYNESDQLVSVELFEGKKTTSVFYTYLYIRDNYLETGISIAEINIYSENCILLEGKGCKVDTDKSGISNFEFGFHRDLQT